MDDWAHQLKWNAIAYASVAGAVLALLLGLWLFVPVLRRRWFPLARLRPGKWDGRDVLLAFCIVEALKLLIVALLLELGFFMPLLGPGPAEDAPTVERTVFGVRCHYVSSPLLLTVILGVLFAVLFARRGVRPHHYGLTRACWPANFALGASAFVLAWPMVMGIFALAMFPFPPRTDRDPLLAFSKLSVPQWEWVLFAFQMTVMAPLVEEILFRGLLQGWLRRATLVGQVMLPFMTVAFASMYLVEYDKASDAYSFHPGSVLFALLLATTYGYWLYHLKRRYDLNEVEMQYWQPLPSAPMLLGAFGMTEEEAIEKRRQVRAADEQRLEGWRSANARLAIFGSAMLFGVVHSGNWPAPLALMPMGLVLGWLAQRTQSLIGPITFHALFNFTSFIALYGSVLSRA